MKKCMIVLCIVLGCSTNPIATNTDRQDIEKISKAITSEPIDSISIRSYMAIVYFKGYTVDSFRVCHSSLTVYTKKFIESAGGIPLTNPVAEGNWIAGSSQYLSCYTIDLHRDFIPFTATTYDTFSIDSLKNFLKYLSDSTMCNDFGCVDMPIDSIESLTWQIKNDTNIIGITQPTSRWEGVTYTFKFLYGVLVNWSQSYWSE